MAKIDRSSGCTSGLAAAVLGAVLGLLPLQGMAGNLSIYADRLAPGWADWSWGMSINPASASTAHGGATSIAVTGTSGWGALYLHPNDPIPLAGYSQVRFWVNGGVSGSQQLKLIANGQAEQGVAFTTVANAWTLVSVPLTALGNPASLTDLYWQDRSGGTQATFYVDDIELVQRSAAPSVDRPLYADGLASGWVDWSWSCARSFSNTAPVHGGSQSIALSIQAAWGALYLHSDAPVDAIGYRFLSFWVHGGQAGNQSLAVSADRGVTRVAFTATAGAWKRIDVPLADLGNPGAITDLWWSDAQGAAQPTLYLDDIALTLGAAGSGTAPVAGPALAVDAAADRHAISADIYGANQASEALAQELRLPVRRWGGNSTSRYNWRNDTTNAGSDWYFENLPLDNAHPETLPEGSSADQFVEQNRRTGTRSLITVPTIGWVAKRRTSGHPYDCGFSVRKYGPQASTDTWDPDCGNGKSPSNAALTGNDPSDTSVAIGPAFVTDWVGHLVARYGKASAGGVGFYALDNEPALWNSTHRDVHPQPLTYDELRDRSEQYGAAIKAGDASALTLGPAEWGWCGYLYSAADQCAPGADAAAHGGVPLVAWYLQQMRGHEQRTGQRVLDYLDLHAYPYANGVSLSPAGDARTQALRLRATRSMWDPNYIDESWVSDTASGGVALQVIPRMRRWVADNYPGTRVAITEYNWGGLEHVNGALAQADLLGIFGREGLDLATLWGDLLPAQPGSYAFRIYRNHDGAGHGFGETGVRAASADQGLLSVYAAQRGSDSALTLIVINKTDSDLISPLALSGFAPRSPAAVYRYSNARLDAIERVADQSVSSNGFSATYPANSITLIVVDADNCAASATGCATVPARVGLTVTPVASSGSGSVDSSPAGIQCGADCSAQFDSGSTVTLTARPAPGSVFVGWSGGCSGVADCVISLTNAARVSAHFIAATQADCLFDWAERNYAAYFPAHVASAVSTPYYFRYYASSGNYLALSSQDDDVWVLGPMSGQQVQDVGAASPFMALAGCRQ